MKWLTQGSGARVDYSSVERLAATANEVKSIEEQVESLLKSAVNSSSSSSSSDDSSSSTPSVSASSASSSPSESWSPNFVSHLFFLAHECLHIGFQSAIKDYYRMHERIARSFEELQYEFWFLHTQHHAWSLYHELYYYHAGSRTSPCWRLRWLRCFARRSTASTPSSPTCTA